MELSFWLSLLMTLLFTKQPATEKKIIKEERLSLKVKEQKLRKSVIVEIKHFVLPSLT